MKRAGDGTVSITVSPENTPEFLEALHRAALANDADGAQVQGKARCREAHRRIVIDWLRDNQGEDLSAMGDFRCVACGHSGIATGGVWQTFEGPKCTNCR